MLLHSSALLSIQMYSTILGFWHFCQEEPDASSRYEELKADCTSSCQGRDVLTATNSNKLTRSHLCSFCSQVLSYYISRSHPSLFSIYSFFCFVPPKNECPGLLLFLLGWTIFVPPSSLFLKIMSSFHTTETFLGLLPFPSALSYCSILSIIKLHAELSLLPLHEWHPSPPKAHSWVKAEIRKHSLPSTVRDSWPFSHSRFILRLQICESMWVTKLPFPVCPSLQKS